MYIAIAKQRQTDRMRARLPLFLFLLLLPVCSRTCLAQQLEELIQQAEHAFRTQDYARAIHYYEAALVLDPEKEETRFNLASSHFRAGNFDEADRYFNEITVKSPLLATALLNRGIIALKKNDEVKAQLILQQAVQQASETQTAQLAQELISRIENSHTRSLSVKPHFGLVSVGIGFEDNVIAPESDAAIATQNPLTELNTFLSYSAYDTQTHETAIYIGGLGVINYATPEYNLGVATIGAEQSYMLKQMRFSGGLETSLESLGDKVYQGSSEIYLKAQQRWASGTTIRLRYAGARIEATLRDFEYNTGWRHRLRADGRFKINAFTVNGLYEYEKNIRQNWGDANDYRSYSPVRNTIRLRIDYTADNKWLVQTTGEYRTSNYSQDNIYQGIPTRRQEYRLRGALVLILQSSDTVSYQFSYNRQRNYSTIDTFDSDRNEFIVSSDVIF